MIQDMVQLTGGIGITWEHDIHMYLRRATANRAVFGTPDQHRERLAALAGL
jgi:alkylation response protein AidB-like acyl-CoA dehydrogenase